MLNKARSLAEHNVGEKEVMLSDRIAREKHNFTATRAERLQNAKMGFFVSMLMGNRNFFWTATRICFFVETLTNNA